LLGSPFLLTLSLIQLKKILTFASLLKKLNVVKLTSQCLKLHMSRCSAQDA